MREKMQACTHRTSLITTADLPLCCPSPEQAIWDAHPRVYLPIHASGEATCPYCSTHYVLLRPIE